VALGCPARCPSAAMALVRVRAKPCATQSHAPRGLGTGGPRAPPPRLHRPVQAPAAGAARRSARKRDETCPLSTGRGTRRVQLVREGEGGAPRERRGGGGALAAARRARGEGSWRTPRPTRAASRGGTARRTLPRAPRARNRPARPARRQAGERFAGAARAARAAAAAPPPRRGQAGARPATLPRSPHLPPRPAPRVRF